MDQMEDSRGGTSLALHLVHEIRFLRYEYEMLVQHHLHQIEAMKSTKKGTVRQASCNQSTQMAYIYNILELYHPSRPLGPSN
jgi:hypothetical protein